MEHATALYLAYYLAKTYHFKSKFSFINFIMFFLIYKKKLMCQPIGISFFCLASPLYKMMLCACIVNFFKNICSIDVIFVWKPVTMTSCVVLSGNVVIRSLSASQSDLNVSLKNITQAHLLIQFSRLQQYASYEQHVFY